MIEQLRAYDPERERKKKTDFEVILEDDLNEPHRENIDQYLREISQIPLLTHEQEVYLAKGIEAKNIAAKKILVRSNTRLVVSIAKKYLFRGVPFLDLIQEGNLGLIRAAEKFDYRRGNRFSSYAIWWITQFIRRNAFSNESTIHIPEHVYDRIFKIRRVKKDLLVELKREATLDEVCVELLKREHALEAEIEKKRTKPPKNKRQIEWINPNEVQLYLDTYRDLISLNTPLGDDPDSDELGDMLPVDPEAGLRPTEELADDETVSARDVLMHLLSKLPSREERILRLRNGLNNKDRIYTLEEIGKLEGTTGERIRQIEERAVQRLSHRVRAYARVKEISATPEMMLTLFIELLQKSSNT